MPSDQSDSMDFESCYWRMVAALEPYWFEQSSMSPETAIAKLVAENERLREDLADARMHLGIVTPMMTPEQSEKWRDRANRFRAEAAAARIRGDG